MSVDYDFTVSKTPSLRSESPDMDTSDDSEIDMDPELAITAAQSPTHQGRSNQFTAERVEVVSAEEADNDEPELVAFHSVLATAYAPASKPSDTKARLAWKAKTISTVQVIA
jgi:hypothetical protein